MKKITINFLHALNPASKHSGIFYENSTIETEWDSVYRGTHKTELIDESVTESIAKVYRSRLGFFSSIRATYDIITGKHYETLTDQNSEVDTSKHGSKGIFDYAILPLFSRVMLHKLEGFHQGDEFQLSTLLTAPIVFCTEICRFIAGASLTAALIPIIGLTCSIRSQRDNKATPLPVPAHFFSEDDTDDIPRKTLG